MLEIQSARMYASVRHVLQSFATAGKQEGTEPPSEACPGIPGIWQMLYKGKTFIGINHDELTQKCASMMDYVRGGGLKSELIRLTGVRTRKMVQIVGDSGQFSEAGTAAARMFLRRYALEGLLRVLVRVC